jgi:hypothetical protein
MYNFTREDIDLEGIRARIARMSDRELLKYGQSGAWIGRAQRSRDMASATRGGRAEWRRRHPAKPEVE